MRDGWEEVTIGEIAEVVAGSTPSTREPSYWGGDIAWITPSEITRQEGQRITRTDRTITEAGFRAIRSPLLPVNTVLLTSRATVGAVALAGVPMAINQGFAALVAGPRVLPEYLMYWCQANRTTFEALAGGSTFPEVGRPAVRSVNLLLPPLAEQRRIVDLIGAVDDSIASVMALEQDLDTLGTALVEEMVFQRDYEWKSLQEIACPKGLAGGPFGSSLTTKDFRTDGVPVIQGANLSGGSPYLSGPFKYVSTAKAASLHNNLAKPADVVVTQRGTLGQVALVPDGGPPIYVVSQSQMRLRVDPTRARSKYAYLVLSSPRLVAEVISQKIATANPHINLGIFRRLRVPVAPMSVQSQIVDLIFGVIAQRVAASRTGPSLRRLRGALLTDLLSCEHEIPASYDRFLDTPAA